jgi:hypothetical protein
MKLIYGITVSTEKEEVIRLLDFIKSNCDDDIIVQIDSKNGIDEFFMEIAKYTTKVYNWYFKNDFSDFKNQLNDSCISYEADYIVQLDADEMVTKKFVKNIKDIIKENMDNTDLIYLPRINKVDGITKWHVVKWNWNMDSLGRINYPDYQGRVYKSNLRWINKIHERIDCPKEKIAYLDDEDYAILHYKTIERQEQQNTFYEKILSGNINN